MCGESKWKSWRTGFLPGTVVEVLAVPLLEVDEAGNFVFRFARSSRSAAACRRRRGEAGRRSACRLRRRRVNDGVACAIQVPGVAGRGQLELFGADFGAVLENAEFAFVGDEGGSRVGGCAARSMRRSYASSAASARPASARLSCLFFA